MRPTEEQYAFGKLLQIATERLFDYLEIRQRPEHRIYESEVIELSEDVNLILVLPPPQKLVQMTGTYYIILLSIYSCFYKGIISKCADFNFS